MSSACSHGLPEAFAVVFEGAGLADPLPDRGLLPRLGFQAEGPMQQGQALVDLVAADGQLRRPAATTSTALARNASASRSRPGQARSTSSGRTAAA